MSQEIERRKIIKQLLLAGFSIPLIGCQPDSNNGRSTDSSIAPINSDNEETEEQPIEEALLTLDSEHVTYFLREDERYEELTTYFNLNCPKNPLIVALPNNEEGVSHAIRYGKQEGLAVSVRSGGHSFEQFSSNIDGLVIHTGLLNDLVMNDDLSITTGPSRTLSELYDFLLPKNRIVPMGSCGAVGVGGLTLGGGYGFFGRKYGLTCDQLVQATFVDGNGEIHHVTQNDDLLWALKGGGNGNFGVVTSMTLTTHPTPTHFSYKKFKAYQLDAPRAKLLLEQWFRLTKDLPNSCFSAFVLNGKTLTLLTTYFEDSDEHLQRMVEEMTPITDRFTESRTEDIPKALKRYYGIQTPIFFKNASAGYYKGIEDIQLCLDDVLERVTSTPGLIYQINTLGGEINSEENKRTSAYPHRDMNYLSELQCYWQPNQSKQREKLTTQFEEIQEIIYNNGVTAQYRNYPSIGFNHWEEAYYRQNYARLQSFKQTYDPDNTIRHEQSVRLPS